MKFNPIDAVDSISFINMLRPQSEMNETKRKNNEHFRNRVYVIFFSAATFICLALFPFLIPYLLRFLALTSFL